MSSLLELGSLAGVVVLMMSHQNQLNGSEPPSALPIHHEPDVKRWKHDGDQPKAERVGNLFPPVPWPEVELFSIRK